MAFFGHFIFWLRDSDKKNADELFFNFRNFYNIHIQCFFKVSSVVLEDKSVVPAKVIYCSSAMAACLFFLSFSSQTGSCLDCQSLYCCKCGSATNQGCCEDECQDNRSYTPPLAFRRLDTWWSCPDIHKTR